MKFNTTNRKAEIVTNHEGDVAYKLHPEYELYTAVMTSSLSDSFYESQSTRMERVKYLVEVCDPVFVGKLAIYARTIMNLRSVPIYLTCLLAQKAAGTDLVSRVIERVVVRADEITELLACYAMVNGREGEKQLGRMSKQVQKGLAAAFNRFDEHQFAKYDRKAAITLRDALFLVHPKAKDERQQAIFDKIVSRTLETPYTWETELSAIGQRSYASDTERAAAVREAWESLIGSGRLGYMALLRNLRNILAANVSPSHIDIICTVLVDPAEVARSKQFPFRFLSAYRQLQDDSPSSTFSRLRMLIKRWTSSSNGHLGRVLDALEQAVDASVVNIPGFDASTRVMIACDVSDSMLVPISKRSTVMNYDIGLMLGMLLRSMCKRAEIGMFGEQWKTITVPASSILANVQTFHEREGEVGYATNGYLVIQDLLKRGVVMDKVMIFTDCQLWNSNRDGMHLQRMWTHYKAAVAPHARLYLFDLAGHGHAPLSLRQNDVYIIAGWSEKIFDVMFSLEQGNTIHDAINAIAL